MKETFDEFLYRQIDFIPTLIKFLFASTDNHLSVMSRDGNVFMIHINKEGHFRRKCQKDGKEIDEPISFTIDDAIAISSQLEASPSDYPFEYANKKEEIEAIVKEYGTDDASC